MVHKDCRLGDYSCTSYIRAPLSGVDTKHWRQFPPKLDQVNGNPFPAIPPLPFPSLLTLPFLPSLTHLHLLLTGSGGDTRKIVWFYICS